MMPPKNVYQLISAVSAEMAKVGISKDQFNPSQRYKFRGIDDVYNALAPILSSVGLVILPRCKNRTVVEREGKSGGAIFYTVVEVEYDFISIHDQSKFTVVMYGEAMDTSDKATNKALSAAYKYACFQTFCIPTEGENDSETTGHEIKSPKKQYIDNMLARFAEIGVTTNEIERRISHPISAINQADIDDLRSVYAAMSAGQPKENYFKTVAGVDDVSPAHTERERP